MIIPCYMFSIPVGALPPFKLREEPWARQAVLDRFDRTGIPHEALSGYQLMPMEEDIVLLIQPDMDRIKQTDIFGDPDGTIAYMEGGEPSFAPLT